MKYSEIISEGLRDPKDNPCWKGYKPVGTKKKDGKTVPNCVPNESVEEAARGIPHKVRFSFDDPSGMGRASGHYTVYAPDKEAARRYTLKDMIQKGKRGVQIHAVTPQKTVDEDWQKVNKHDKTDGMSSKAVKAYRREHPGSKLQTAVTTKPSKLKAGSKDAKRRKSFCARMSGVEGPMKDEKGRPTAKAKALKRWNCE